MTISSKTFTESISQKEKLLGPVWQSTRRNTSSGDSLGDGNEMFASGRDRRLANRIIEMMTKAQQMVVVCTFLLADEKIVEALIAASNRGVRVYLGLATETQLNRVVSDDDDFGKDVVQHHKKMLQNLEGHVLIRSAGHYHAKVILIDPKYNPKGILLTANLTKEALERNEELGVLLSADEVQDAYSVLRWELWERAEHDNLTSGKMQTVRPLGVVSEAKGLSSSLVATSGDLQSIRRTALDLVNSAKESLVVSSFGWQNDHELVQRICERAAEGLSVTVLCRHRPSAMDALIALSKAGATVLGFKWLHAKAVVADGSRGIVMSANFERHGMDDGFELGVLLEGGRASELRTLLDSWIESAPWSLSASPCLGELLGKIMLHENGRLVEAEVKAEASANLGSLTARSIEALDAIRPADKEFEKAQASHPFAHAIECRWTVVPPKLPKSAKPVDDQKGEAHNFPRLYKEGKRLLVAISIEGQLAKALDLKQISKADAIVATGKEASHDG